MSLDTSNSPLQQLVDKFHTLVDEAVIYAIASDYDLDTSPGYKSAHDTLQSLSADVVIEEATGFNPSGTSGAVCDDVSTTGTSPSNHGSGSRSNSTEVSSAATDTYSCPQLTSFDNSSDDTKIRNLKEMFLELKEFDIRNALKQNAGGFQATFDHLLTLQYLEHTGQREKGVDSFFRPDDEYDWVTLSKGKKKRRQASKDQRGVANSQAIPPKSPPSREKSLDHDDEISYLADRIDCMSYNQISTIYHNKKFSSGATIVEILGQYIDLGIKAEDKDGIAKAKELGSKFRNIPDEYLLTLVQIARPPSHFSDDIAALLSKHFTRTPCKQRLELSHRTTPLPNEELESAWITPTKGRTSLGQAQSGSTSGKPTMDLSLAHQKILQSYDLKNEAKLHASQLSRRAGPLYKQAAHVYRDRANEHAAVASALTSSAADQYVSQNSTNSSIDLHGVFVRDGVRIARQRVQDWWDSLEEFQRARRARENGFTVITGVGRHSAGGVSQLRKSVAAALVQDGWKMTVGTGRFTITGRR